MGFDRPGDSQRPLAHAISLNSDCSTAVLSRYPSAKGSRATVRYAMHLQIPGDTPAGPLRIIWDLYRSGAMAMGTLLITH